MKTIKIITLSILFTLTNLSFAQDSTNTATWEETIGFIQKYNSYISTSWPESEDQYEFNINGTSVTITYRNKGSQTEYMESLPLNKLTSKSIVKTNGNVWLYTTGDNVKYTDSGSSEIRFYSTIRFVVKDDEIRPRLVKAFKHLAYLATEKRKEEREASGDKF